MSCHALESGRIRLVVGDNGSEGDHRPGYNGIWSLSHSARPENAFVPAFSGYNLEHIFNGVTTNQPDVFYEPRRWPMELKVIDNATVELHQPPTPISGVGSITRFSLTGDDRIDFEFRATPTRLAWPHGYLGFFWASYIHGPDDKSLYHRGGLASSPDAPQWMQLCTQEHGRDASVCHRSRRHELPASCQIPRCLFQSLSPQVWEEPVLYGRLGDLFLVTLFENDPRLRWAHSPSGGGITPQRETTNPAWDFQWILEQPRVGEEYRLRARIIYRKEMTRSKILQELTAFKAERSIE